MSDGTFQTATDINGNTVRLRERVGLWTYAPTDEFGHGVGTIIRIYARKHVHGFGGSETWVDVDHHGWMFQKPAREVWRLSGEIEASDD